MEKKIIKFCLYLIFCFAGCNPYGKLIDLNNVENIEIVVNKTMNTRGVLIINDTYTVLSGSKLIALQSNFKITDNRYKLYFNGRDMTRRIIQLKTPFKIVKRKTQNMVLVIKERDTFGFNLVKY